MPRSPTETIRFLTLDETARLFRAIGSHRRDRALFLIAYLHGMRASEVGLLRVEDLDLEILRIMVHRLKGSHSGAHPLQDDEAKALKALLRERKAASPILFPSSRGDPIARRTLDWLTKKYGEAAELPPAKRHFHCLKHSIDDPDVYVVGECAQHRGMVYGLVAPLWEQAKVLADHITGKNREAAYHGSKLATKLKVMGVELASMGVTEPAEERRRGGAVLRAQARHLQEADHPRRPAGRRRSCWATSARSPI